MKILLQWCILPSHELYESEGEIPREDVVNVTSEVELWDLLTKYGKMNGIRYSYGTAGEEKYICYTSRFKNEKFEVDIRNGK
jgi:hypothetical protein